MNNRLVLSVFGSYMYGTNTKNSDIDYRAVDFLPVESMVGLGDRTPSWKQTIKDGTDNAGWFLPDFCRLIMKGAPDATEFLFGSRGEHQIGWLFIQDSLFRFGVSAVVRDTFERAALQKLYRFTGKHLPEELKAKSDALRYNQEATELLETGRITFPRPNAEFLRAIRLGLTEPSDWTGHFRDSLECLRNAKSILPESADYNAVNRMVEDVTLQWLSGRREEG